MVARERIPFSMSTFRIPAHHLPPCSAQRRSVYPPSLSLPCPRSRSLSMSLMATQITSRKGLSTFTPPVNPRWLSEQKTRLGRCILFGLDRPQIDKAGQIARTLGEDWRGLVAGADGYLVSKNQTKDSWEQKVLWGEMVSMLYMSQVMRANTDRRARTVW